MIALGKAQEQSEANQDRVTFTHSNQLSSSFDCPHKYKVHWALLYFWHATEQSQLINRYFINNLISERKSAKNSQLRSKVWTTSHIVETPKYQLLHLLHLPLRQLHVITFCPACAYSLFAQQSPNQRFTYYIYFLTNPSIIYFFACVTFIPCLYLKNW